MKGMLIAALAASIGCRDHGKQGLPPANDWTGGTSKGGAKPERDEARFDRCFVQIVASDPLASAAGLRVFARHAPPADAKRVIAAVVDVVPRIPMAARAKVLGEASWAL